MPVYSTRVHTTQNVPKQPQTGHIARLPAHTGAMQGARSDIATRDHWSSIFGRVPERL